MTSLSDNTEYRDGVGVNWDAAAVTFGTVRIGYGGFYDLRSRLRLGLEATYQNRQSTDDLWDFDRTILMFTVGGTL